MLEAMASGVPPLMTTIAGVPEVVTDRETGILLEPGRPDNIEAAIIELFDDEAFRAELAGNARDYVFNNLTWEQRTERVIRVYDQIAGND
jgi:glycosyltransferase involved in cell wall biosynthesis